MIDLRKILRDKIKAFLNHFIISFFFLIFFVVWVYFLWYPTPLLKAVGGDKILMLVIFVDVFLGPLLTFIIYKENKKNFKFDLVVICVLQITAFGYGVYSIAQARPVWIVYNIDRFELIRTNELIEQNTQHALPKYQKPRGFKPQWVGVTMSNNLEEKNQDLFEEALVGISIAQRPERYVDLEKVTHQIQARARNLNELKQYNSSVQIDKILRKYPQANAWVPLKANAVDMTVLVNKEKAEVVKIVDLRPWN